MASTPRYSKNKRRIVIAFDIGTTFSGASYSIIEPGQTPLIRGVNKYPGQERAGGDAKIPSIILYDSRGEVAAVGPKAQQFAKIEENESEGGSSLASYSEITWFKLHFRPRHISLPREISALPTNKSAVDVFADFLKYLYECVLDYIRQKHFNGVEIIGTMKDSMHFLLTHPNGWEGAQQTRLRKAAIQAGLLKDMKDASERLCLLTEGEAAVHYCVRHALSFDTLNKSGEMEGIMVIDAGGGTIDISAYTRDPDETGPLLKLKEIVPPRCIFHGSIFVTQNAKDWLSERLRNSPCYADLDHIVDCFDRTAKCRFTDMNNSQYIKYGTARDNDRNVGIRCGQMIIPGDVMAGFFEPSISEIVKAVREICDESDATSGMKIKKAFLVGGFATSEWLSGQLNARLNDLGVTMQSPDQHLNKAVADGAVSYYLDHFVTTRVSKYTYGTMCYQPYDSSLREHRKRAAKVFHDVDGERYLPGIFCPILQKGQQVKEIKEFRETFYRREETKASFKTIMFDKILCYKGSKSNCEWSDQEPDMYPVLCTVKSDVSQLVKYLRPCKGRKGDYYELTYDVILSFGLAELRAEVELRYHSNRKKQTVKRSAAEIIYDEDSENDDDMYGD